MIFNALIEIEHHIYQRDFTLHNKNVLHIYPMTLLDSRPVLNVASSLTGRRWHERCDESARLEALRITQLHGLDERLARVLAGRGVHAEELPSFLDPKLRDTLPDPMTFTQMSQAADRLADAVMRNEHVAVFGDYDVDGACSAALMTEGLRMVGVENVRIHIPDRITEGYGPNIPAIRALREAGADLLVSVDCGTSGHVPFEEAKRLGLDVVVLDHHQASETLPNVSALVNPNRLDDLSGQGHLCAAGVVFVTLVALYRTLKARGALRHEPDLMRHLDLVALATVADVVPLKGVNRAFVRQGIAIIRSRSRPGMRALMDIAGLKEPAQPWHLGFMVAPRINAGGRIGNAGLGARLLLSQDEAEVAQIAQELDQLNRERQVIEQAALLDAEAQAIQQLDQDPDRAVIVLAHENWHPGILGLISSRLKEKYNRPVFSISLEEDGGGHGSGRSISGVDLGSAVRAAVEADVLTNGGGHAMAAGITVKPHGVRPFADFMTAYIRDAVGAARLYAGLAIDSVSTSQGLSVSLLEELDKAGPYGANMPEPVFAIADQLVDDVRIVGMQHVKLRLRGGDGGIFNAMIFRAADTLFGQELLRRQGTRLHVAGTLSVDHWGNIPRVQMRLMDAANV